MLNIVFTDDDTTDIGEEIKEISKVDFEKYKYTGDKYKRLLWIEINFLSQRGIPSGPSPDDSRESFQINYLFKDNEGITVIIIIWLINKYWSTQFLL